MIEAVFLGMIIPLIFLIVVLKGENRMIMAFFSWGLVAFALSLFVNNAIVKNLGISTAELSVTWAPILEELFKALPLVYFLVIMKDTDYPIHYFAMAAGIGFSIQENYMYLFNQMGEGSPVYYIILRSVTTCLMHGIATAIIGYGLSLIKKLRVLMLPLLFGLFSISITLHALFNLYINSGLKLLGMVLPVILYIVGLVILTPDQESAESVQAKPSL